MGGADGVPTNGIWLQAPAAMSCLLTYSRSQNVQAFPDAGRDRPPGTDRPSGSAHPRPRMVIYCAPWWTA
jgi:hypothetical protein